MNLNSTLKEFEAVEANLAKLERLWDQMKVLIPGSNVLGVSESETYLRAQRSFEQIIKGMPAIDGVKLKNCTLHPDDITTGKIDCLELGEVRDSIAFDNALFSQTEELNSYRFRMEAKRRELARQAVADLSSDIDSILQALHARESEWPGPNILMPVEEWNKLRGLFKSIDALLGSSIGRAPRWNHMARHLSFGVRQDLDDIVSQDWPDIRQWLERALYGESDALPVTATDLGELVRAKPKGPVATELIWSRLSPSSFERLVFNLINRTPGYVNPQWLTHTTAPDRGRDLSVERLLQDPLTGTRSLRIILACKHTDSVNLTIIAGLREQMRLWEPPRVDELIIVTTGRFTTDAIDYVERHNRGGDALRLEMWPGSQLERLLADRPELIADFQLRN
jgi:hypothetical protein